MYISGPPGVISHLDDKGVVTDLPGMCGLEQLPNGKHRPAAGGSLSPQRAVEVDGLQDTGSKEET
jgi:hypothetical protein